MDGCIFCRIVAREVPADIVYEDERTLAFLDMHPNHPGHTLIVPKHHSRNIFDIDAVDWSAVQETTRKLARHVRIITRADGVNIHVNNEPAANQVVFHTHAHLIPRYTGDTLRTFPPGVYTHEGQAAALALALRQSLEHQ